MARQKLYYTSAEIINNLYTPGGEFEFANGQTYIGQYHRYTTGEVYTGSTWSPKTSKRLIVSQPESAPSVKLFKQLNNELRTSFIVPKPVPLVIQQTDITRGYVKRFILYNHINKTIVEVDLSQYEQWQQQNIDPALYDAYAINWYISGNLYTVTVNGITELGVYNRNLATINRLIRINPVIAEYLSDPISYYTDSTVNKPKNINS